MRFKPRTSRTESRGVIVSVCHEQMLSLLNGNMNNFYWHEWLVSCLNVSITQIIWHHMTNQTYEWWGWEECGKKLLWTILRYHIFVFTGLGKQKNVRPRFKPTSSKKCNRSANHYTYMFKDCTREHYLTAAGLLWDSVLQWFNDFDCRKLQTLFTWSENTSLNNVLNMWH